MDAREKVVLVCVDNDAESRMICQLAAGLGMALVRSAQPHGARLEKEPDLWARLAATEKYAVWTVEIPGPETEASLAAAGFSVTVIDHHAEKGLDRSHDADGNRRPSSLEQFLALADVRDGEIAALGHDPRTVRGLGIFDDRYVQGLRDAGYAPAEINAVLDLRNALRAEIEPNFAQEREAAEEAWKRRRTHGRYLVALSDRPQTVRAETAMLSIRDGVDTQPLVIAEHRERALYVQNVEPVLVAAIQEKLGPGRHSYTFGAGRCLGIKNRKGAEPLTLAQLLAILDDLDPHPS